MITTGPTPAGLDGIERSRKHAEADSPGWTERAADALVVAVRNRGDATVDEVRNSVEALVGAPAEARAWGAATRFAMRRKWIEPTGSYRRAESSNGSAKPVYRATEAL